jgi:hypothetical protein
MRGDADQHAESRPLIELEQQALVRDRVDSAVNDHLARHRKR